MIKLMAARVERSKNIAIELKFMITSKSGELHSQSIRTHHVQIIRL
jgi:hypothetical protein